MNNTYEAVINNIKTIIDNKGLKQCFVAEKNCRCAGSINRRSLCRRKEGGVEQNSQDKRIPLLKLDVQCKFDMKSGAAPLPLKLGHGFINLKYQISLMREI